MTDEKNKSLSEVNASVRITNSQSKWKKLFSFVGPAFLVSVGYMDPGNWATDLAAGSKYGYSLIWVLVMSNFMAIVLQYLCTKLGVVAGRDLAQVSKDIYPSWANIILWVLAELAIAATDLAEVIGMAIGLQLLFGIPLLLGVLITILDTFLIMILQQYGIRKMEAFIFVLIFTITLCFGIQLFISQPLLSSIFGGLRPSIPDSGALFFITGIIGATVMPHNLYLHSALVQSRKIDDTNKSKKIAIKFNLIDSIVALNLAFFVNASILILSATVFYKNGHEVTGIREAHKMLEPLLGTSWAPVLFAIALIAAGQSSTVTGTLAGQVVMEGHLNLRLRPWLRRLVTRSLAIVPAIITIIYFGELKLEKLLILSQVLLSLQLGFAIIPLIHTTSSTRIMGVFKNKKWLIMLAAFITMILVYLNLNMIVEELKNSTNILASFGWIFFIGMIAFLVFVTLYPFFIRYRRKHILPHKQASKLDDIILQKYRNIAIPIDFSSLDTKVISNALLQGDEDATFHLIHIVETPAAFVFKDATQDFETKKDLENLKNYQYQLQEKGFDIQIHIGYGNPADNLVKIIKALECDLVVMGQHRHKGLKDIVYGQTINKLRHNIPIPLFLVT